jgi:hypothetical protein
MVLHDTPEYRGISPARNSLTTQRGFLAFAAPRYASRLTHMMQARADYTPTPDRRYFVVRGRLWRLSNPSLDSRAHEQLVSDLMDARRAVREAADPRARLQARRKVDDAKRALGERGHPWWDDGAPDYNRRLALNTPYAAWFNRITGKVQM